MRQALTIRGSIAIVLASTIVVFLFAMGLHRGHLLAANARLAQTPAVHEHGQHAHDGHTPSPEKKPQLREPHCPLCRLADGLALPPPDVSLTVPVVFVAWIVPTPTEIAPPAPRNVAARPRGPPAAT